MIIKGFRVYGPLVIQRIEEPIYIWYEEAEDCLYVEASGTGTAATSPFIVTKTAQKDLGEEKTVKFISGTVSGGVTYSISGDPEAATNYGGGGYGQGTIMAYVECRNSANDTVIKFSLPLLKPLLVRNVRYIVLTIKVPVAAHSKTGLLNSYSYVANASVQWKILE